MESAAAHRDGAAKIRFLISLRMLVRLTGLKSGSEQMRQLQKRRTGVGQLTLVEHALCPLDSRSSLVQNLVFDTEYFYSGSDQQRKRALARVFCPLGLSASDELYLWGLLALTLLQPEPEPELFATPHWCLSQLGIINQSTKRGGRQYQQFADAIRRLSAVTYMNDGFYDPARAEHRRVSLRFFSYSLPVDLNSSRAWRIAWDPIFFEMVKAASGHFRFDLAIYRELDAASRRLFLFASKVLSRRTHLKALRLEDVAVNLLGFQASLATRDMKTRVNRCLKKLIEQRVLADAEIFRTSPGKYFVRLTRGRYFEDRSPNSFVPGPEESPVFETLKAIGFEDDGAARVISRFPARLVAEWTDITQAALERFGKDYFHKSPMAYLVDSLNKAVAGQRTAPDWWHELKQSESQKLEMSKASRDLFAKLQNEVFGPNLADTQPSAKVSQRRGFVSAANVLNSK